MKSRWLCIITAVILLLCGCSADKEAANAPHADNISENINQDTARDPNGDDGYEFIFVCPIVENEYWYSCYDGMKKADEKFGTTTTEVGPKTADNFSVEIVEHMRKAVDAKPDGIIAYAGIEALEPLIEEAHAQGIPVLAIDSDAPNTSRIAYIGFDSYNLGYSAGEALAEATGGSAKVGVLVSAKSAEKEMQVLGAFKDAVSDYDIEIVDIKETDANPDVAEEKTRIMLEAHPEIDAMYSTAGYNVTGAARVKEELGLDDLKLVGYDDVRENLDFVRKGVIDVLIAQRINQAGYQSVQLLKEYLDNGSLPNEYYDTGTILLNRGNVDTYTLQSGSIGVETKDVKVGYYIGDPTFQDGFDESERKSGYAYEYYQSVAAIAGWNYNYVYGSREDIINMLIDGEVDIVAGVYKTNALGDRILFSEHDMGLDGVKRYFAVNADRVDLLMDLNYAMKQIEQSKPDYTISLLQKYYTRSVQQVLNDDEAAWLEGRASIKIGYVRDNMPLSGEAENGEPEGVVKDVMDIIKNYIYMDIEPVGYDNVESMEAGLKNGEVDAAFPIYSDLWLSEKKGFYQTDTFISDRVMLVYSGSYSEDLMEKVAFARTNMGIKYYLETAYPETETIGYGSVREALKAVYEGRERCVVGCSGTLQRLLKENSEYQKLNVAYLGATQEFGMAVKKSDSLLLRILNKCIREINAATITSSFVKYGGVKNEYSIREFIRQNSLYFVIFMSVFTAILAVVFMGYIRSTYLFKREQARANEALEGALKKANAANEAKTNFLSSISHDIRTPMNAIVGMTSIAHMNINDRDKVKDCLDKIELSSRHLLTLINNVLDISKIESSQMQLNPVVFSLKDTVNNLLHIVKPQIEDKNIELQTNISDFKYEMVYADEVRVNQIFMNILSNAIKYTHNGGKVVVEIEEMPLPDNERVRVKYSVEDNGIGMSEEYMAKMYKAFTRAKDSRINKIQGTGLGLAIVKQMVDMMEGDIECISEEGKGTKFIVTLEMPIRCSTEKLAESGNDADAKTGIDGNSFIKGRHLLIAEDNELNWEVIIGILEMYGVTADRAVNGKVCVDMIKEAPEGTYDLILMDIQMPIMNGRDATREIRKDERDYVRNIPIIAMTADAFAEDIKASFEAGMNGHVSKPIDIDKLMQEMRKVVSG